MDKCEGAKSLNVLKAMNWNFHPLIKSKMVLFSSSLSLFNLFSRSSSSPWCHLRQIATAFCTHSLSLYLSLTSDIILHKIYFQFPLQNLSIFRKSLGMALIYRSFSAADVSFVKDIWYRQQSNLLGSWFNVLEIYVARRAKK